MEDESKKIEYISLAEAATLCSYSQEYLSLRARQGKLRAVKLGRNWVTTKAWLEQYVRAASEYNGANREKEAAELIGKERDGRKEKLVSGPPENLPVGEVVLRPFSQRAFRPFSFQVVFGASLLLLTVLLGIVSFLPVVAEEQWSFTVDLAREYGLWVAGEAGELLSKDWKQAAAQINLERIALAIDDALLMIREDVSFAIKFLKEKFQFFAGGEKAPEAGKLLSGKTEELEQDIISDIQKRFAEFREDVGIAQKGKEGFIAIPSAGEKDEETKKKITELFSDEVVIEQKDETSGIIRPVFKTMAEQAYLYMMVPLRN